MYLRPNRQMIHAIERYCINYTLQDFTIIEVREQKGKSKAVSEILAIKHRSLTNMNHFHNSSLIKSQRLMHLRILRTETKKHTK